MRAVIYGDTDSIYVKSEKDISDILNKHVIPAYYKKHGLETDVKIVLEDEYGIIDMILLPDIKKTYMFRIRETGEVVGKSIDKRSFIKISVDLYMYITKKIFDGEITNWLQILDIQEKILSGFKFDERYLKPYSINKPLDEYKNQQDWMAGIEWFKRLYPDYKGYINSGYIIHLYGKPRYSDKTKKRLKYDEEVRISIPSDMMDRVDEVIHKLQIEYGHKVRMNEKYYREALFGRLKIFKKILEG